MRRRPTCIATGALSCVRNPKTVAKMWRDICVANREALLAELDGYLATLGTLRQLIDAGDGAGLEAVFARTSQARTDWAKQQEK